MSCFRSSTEDNISSVCVTQIDFRSKKGSNLYVFELRYQNIFSTPQTVFVYLGRLRDIDAGRLIGYAFLLRNRKMSISNAGQRHLELI